LLDIFGHHLELEDFKIEKNGREKRDLQSSYVGMQPEKGKRAGARHTWRLVHLRNDDLTVPDTNLLRARPRSLLHHDWTALAGTTAWTDIDLNSLAKGR
jgi:hypothetical protein